MIFVVQYTLKSKLPHCTTFQGDFYNKRFLLGNNDDKMGCKTVSGPSPNASCIFPFKLGEITYHKCLTNPKNLKDVCATSVDESGELVDFTKYGVCEQGCNLKIGKNDFITSIIGL